MSVPDFTLVERIADVVLFEGYVLYPYRASAAKNQYRWQFGIVAPCAPRGEGEPSFSQTECVITPAAARMTRAGLQASTEGVAPILHVRLRCLRPRASAGEVSNAERPWLEGVPCTHDLPSLSLQTLPMATAVDLNVDGISARILITARRESSSIVVRLRLENVEPWRSEFDDNRDAMLRRSLVGTHIVLAVENGSFESLVEPREAVQPIVASLRNEHTWPVLVGDRAQRNLMLSSPIILYDFPTVAKESPGDLCDGAEIDEILTLRILTLTAEEKVEARRTDPRARAILDRVEALAPSEVEALHGTMRSADFFNPPGTPSPEHASIVVDGRRVTRGSHVRLRPNRRADAMDIFLRDQCATVAGVYRDVDDRVYVAVTVDADPAAAMHESFGRFFYFDPTEVEPLELV